MLVTTVSFTSCAQVWAPRGRCSPGLQRAGASIAGHTPGARGGEGVPESLTRLLSPGYL